MSEKEEVLPLPDMPQSQQGTSTATGKGYTASVSNAAGYLCHIQLECKFEVPPEVIFEIFCHPDNAGAFRDIKCVGYRKVKVQEPNYKLVEVEQCGELRVLWIHRVFKTYLDVTEDARDPECLKTEFTLLRSDLLSRFHGSWELRPIKDTSGKVTGCHAVLSQDVLPKGVPTFFAHLPVLGGLLRRVSLGTIQRLIEDILYIVKKYTNGGGKLSVDDCIAKIAAERGHKTNAEENRPGSSGGEGSSESNGASSSDNNNNSSNTAVASFAIESFSESEGEEDEDADQVAANPQQDEAAPAAAAGDASSAAAPTAAAKVQPEQQAEEQQQQQPGAGASSSAGSARASADGEVLIAPTSGSSSKDSSTAAVAAEAPKQHKHHAAHKQQQQHKHQPAEYVDPGSPAVGVLLDVSVHDHVHVGLITNPEA